MPQHVPLLLALFFATTVTAQQATSPATPTNSSEERVVLSPFEVLATPDAGYAVPQTLAGTRFKSNLADLSSAITVFTPDLLKDIGATDFESMINFFPNTETFTTDGNDPVGNGGRYGTQYVVRGLRSGTVSANFFLMSVAPDTYNLESISSNRGPNSILFGAGAPGGLIDSQTKQARLDRQKFAVDGRYQSAGDGLMRVTFDYNRPLIKNKLGLRVATLHQNGGIDRVPTRNDRNSVYLAATYKPWSESTLKLNAEHGWLRASKGRTYVPWDWYTPWVAAGRPIVTGTAVPASTTGLQRLGANFLVVIEDSPLPVMNWGLAWRGAPPTINGVANASVSFTKDYVVPMGTNIAGLSDLVDQNYRNYSVFFEQKLAKNLYVEVAGNYENFHRFQFDAVRGADYAIQVDASALLPDGRPNPNVGLPYIESTGQTLFGEDENYTQQSRVTLTYELNLNDRKILGMGLGRFKFAGIGSYWRSIVTMVGGQEVNTTPAPGFSALLDNAANRIHRRFYLRPDGPQHFVGSFAAIDQAAGAHASIPAVRARQTRSLALPRYNTEELAALGSVSQGFFFNDRVVVTYGLRRDDASVRSSFFARGSNGVVADLETRVPNAPTTTSVVTQSFGGVLHVHKFFSLFANKSDNFRPPSGSVFNIYGETVKPTSGVGTDYGIKVRLLDERITASVAYFENSQLSVYSSADTVTNRGPLQNIWNAIDASKAPPSGWNASRDAVSTGIEAELVFNPTRQWRIAFNGARNENLSSNLIPEILEYIAENRATWEANASLPAPNAANTVAVQLVALDKSISEILAQQGNRRLGEREWSANVVTSYRFAPTSKLKAWSVGSVGSWRSQPVIGFRLDNRGQFNKADPFFGKSLFLLDSFINYRRPIRERELSVQFRVTNLLDENDPYVLRAIDDGRGNATPTTVLVSQNREFSLSVGVSF